MAHDVFISYSTKDKAIAEAVCATLEQRKIRCWIAPRDILPGDDWGEAIIDALTGCKIAVLIFSSGANESPQVKREVQIAFEEGATVIPFRVEDVAPEKSLKFYMRSVHWLDALTPPIETHLENLAEKVQHLLTRHQTEEEATAVSATPGQPAPGMPKPAATPPSPQPLPAQAPNAAKEASVEPTQTVWPPPPTYSPPPSSAESPNSGRAVLKIIGAVVVMLWLIGFLMHVGGELIHILLLASILMFLYLIFTHKR